MGNETILAFLLCRYVLSLIKHKSRIPKMKHTLYLNFQQAGRSVLHFCLLYPHTFICPLYVYPWFGCKFPVTVVGVWSGKCLILLITLSTCKYCMHYVSFALSGNCLEAPEIYVIMAPNKDHTDPISVWWVSQLVPVRPHIKKLLLSVPQYSRS